VLRRESGELRYYAHLGTGNYHPTTTKHYTDFGLLTAHPALTAEVNEIFIHLTSLTKPKKLHYLWLAPFALQKEIIKAIRNEAAIARAGRPARIIAKMNALLDESVIRALYAASADGVKIDLIVRGACALQPGVRGLSKISACARSSAASLNIAGSITFATIWRMMSIWRVQTG
jgi:polyphosphate kinase